jgi:hypothetical protein
MESNDLTGNRTRDVDACSIPPQLNKYLKDGEKARKKEKRQRK